MNNASIPAAALLKSYSSGTGSLVFRAFPRLSKIFLHEQKI